MSVTNLSRIYISPVILLLFSFIVISFFWIACDVCGDGDCQNELACLDPEVCCPSGDCPDGDACVFEMEVCQDPPVEGACCLDITRCLRLTAEDCAGMGGDFQGDDTSCETPNICQPPTIPTLNRWGMIIMAGVLGLFAVIGLFVMRRRNVVMPSN